MIAIVVNCACSLVTKELFNLPVLVLKTGHLSCVFVFCLIGMDVPAGVVPLGFVHVKISKF